MDSYAGDINLVEIGDVFGDNWNDNLSVKRKVTVTSGAM